VHIRGMSSAGVGEGYKRSLNVSLDFADSKQRLYGYKTLNLLNAHEDPTFLHTVLYSHIARQYTAAPKANFAKVVINGESWGVYANVQQFDKISVKEWFPAAKGDKGKKGDAKGKEKGENKGDKSARWKVPGSPGGRGGLNYLGEDVEAYKRTYEIKSDDDEKSWKALVELCRTLEQTPTDQLEEALKPILDIDGVLWFLAMENVFINSDGYWIRAYPIPSDRLLAKKRMIEAMTRRLFNLVVTNVPGPQFPLYAAGARMLAMYPVVPLAKGQALSIGLTSYDGGVYYGLNADRDAMADVDVLAGLLEESLAELVGTVH